MTHARNINHFALTPDLITALRNSPAVVRTIEATPPPHDVPGSALQGLPFGVKDNIDVKDVPTAVGTAVLGTVPAPDDAAVVALLRSAGALPIAKTGMYELALGNTSINPNSGDIPNPHDTTRSAGGSSGGSAAIVAAGLVPFALGTDTGGSVRLPAAFCGVVGFRPSAGRYPSSGVAPLASTRDTVGILANSVTLVDEVDTTITGERKDDSFAHEDLVFAIPESADDSILDEFTKCAWRDALSTLSTHGIKFIKSNLDLREIYSDCERDILFHEAGAQMQSWLDGRNESVTDLQQLTSGLTAPLSRSVFEAIVAGDLPDEEATRCAYSAMEDMRGQHRAALHGITALIYPTVPIVAPPLTDSEETTIAGRRVPLEAMNVNIGPSTITGAPTISLPLNTNSMPVGFSLEGAIGDDKRLLAAARYVESLLATAESSPRS